RESLPCARSVSIDVDQGLRRLAIIGCSPWAWTPSAEEVNMLAMALAPEGGRLLWLERPGPQLGPGELLLRVHACGVCRTDLHVIDGELAPVRAPIIPGHEVVGVVEALAADVTGFLIGERLGAAWLASTCGRCRYCLEGAENLCDRAEFNGWTRDGG